MRNNDDRLGTNEEHSTPLAPLEFVVPTSFVKLPSGGKFYPEGHPLCNQDTVEIKEMTAKEEDILSSRALIEKGVAVDRLVDSLLMDKSIKCDSLVVGDKNAIIVQARIGAYGSDYQAATNCPACGETTKHTFNLSDIEPREIVLGEGVTQLPNNNISIKLSNGWDVECKMLKGSDEAELLRQAERKKKRKEEESPLTDLLNAIIVSISGHTDPKTIREAVAYMPAKDTKMLREAYQGAMPSLDMSQEITCSHCGHEAVMEVPLTAEFFWPKQ